eukprot:1136682-Pelagomonas_calceolata.AAC.4
MQPIQVPYGLSAMSFFVSIPQIALPEGKMRLTPCDIVKIFTGKVTSWSGFGLAAKDVTFFYRVQSGSTALISSYLSEACPAEWTFSKAVSNTLSDVQLNQIPAGPSVLATEIIVLPNNSHVQLAATPWAIGYMDSGIGQNFATLVEVSLQNSAGQFLTSRESEISEAASGVSVASTSTLEWLTLLKRFILSSKPYEVLGSGHLVIRSGAWPADPTSDFSGSLFTGSQAARIWAVICKGLCPLEI